MKKTNENLSAVIVGRLDDLVRKVPCCMFEATLLTAGAVTGLVITPDIAYLGEMALRDTSAAMKIFVPRSN